MLRSHKLPTNKWIIEQRDTRRVVLLKDGEEKVLTNAEVGMVYVVDSKGDYIEDAPLPEEFDLEEYEY